MNVCVVPLANEKNPIEMQAWLDANPAALVFQIILAHDVFYVFYS